MLKIYYNKADKDDSTTILSYFLIFCPYTSHRDDFRCRWHTHVATTPRGREKSKNISSKSYSSSRFFTKCWFMFGRPRFRRSIPPTQMTDAASLVLGMCYRNGATSQREWWDFRQYFPPIQLLQASKQASRCSDRTPPPSVRLGGQTTFKQTERNTFAGKSNVFLALMLSESTSRKRINSPLAEGGQVALQWLLTTNNSTVSAVVGRRLSH